MNLFCRFLPAMMLLIPAMGWGQSRATVSGYITDSGSGETLIGAGVKEGDNGAASNSYGFYSLPLKKGIHTLSYSYLGFAEQTVSLDLTRDTIINIALKPDASLAGATVVAGKDAGILSTKMSAIEVPVTAIKNVPVLFGEADVLKIIQLLPGVKSGNEGFSGLYVRGGGPEENLLLLDGIALYNAEHMLGILSVFQPEAVKKVTLYKGSFPARYGGRISSIIDIRTNDGNLKEYHGTVGVGALTDKVHLEGPIIKDKLAFSLSGRVLHNFLFSPIIHKMAGTPTNYYFYDANAKLSWRISDRDRLFANFYNGKDLFYYKDKDKSFRTGADYSYTSSNKIDINWGNILLGLRWNHVFGSHLFSNATLAFTRYRMNVGLDMVEKGRESGSMYENVFRFEYNSGMRDITAKIDFDYTPVPEQLIKFGAEYVHHTFIPETVGGFMLGIDGEEVVDTTFHAASNAILAGHEMSLYAEDDIIIGDHLVLNPGFRAAFFYTQKTPYFSFEPRISARFKFSEDLSAKAAYSRMAQYVHLLSPAKITLPIDLWVPITDKIKPVTSDQLSLGLYYGGWKGWELSLEGYYKWMHNILEYRDGTSFFGNSSNWQNNVEMGEGLARGVELFVEKTMGKTTGWLGYTLSWSDRFFPGGSINGGEIFPYRYDRRHDISLVANHSFNKKWSVSATWTFATGGTVTIPERQTVVVTPGGEVRQHDYISRRNNYRLPSSHRLNLSLNRTRRKRHGEAVWNLSVYNVYNSMTPNFVFTEIYDGQIHLKKITILPVIPSVSWTRKF